MRVELAQAILLHRRAWRDTSLIVEAFSREHGRIGVIAKGARAARSRWRGLLEPLAAVALSWTGRGELYTLTGVDLVHSHALSGNALMGGLYAAELTLRLTARDDPQPGIHGSLTALLSALDEGAPPIVALRFFERDLLSESGYGLNLAVTAEGEPVVAAADYAYHPTRGLRRVAARLQDSEVGVAGRSLIALESGRFPDREAIHQARNLMQVALAPHIGSRPLKSVQTARAMRQFAGGGTPNSGNSAGASS
jgi:DNA repair protein RecO (recombination protein O)